MLLEPAPSALDQLADVRALGDPAELARNLVGVGVELRRIPRPAQAHVHLKIARHDGPRGFDDLLYAVAATDTEVIDEVLAWTERSRDEHVRFDQIFDMNVVAHARAVRRRIVFAEDRDFFAPAERSL